ncbi:hypothetical protein HDV63DRAFT_405326 [Trichoderma sp. SZMC 28014]
MSTYCFFEQFKTDYGKRFGVPGIIKGMVVKEASACVRAWPRASLQTDRLKMNEFAGPNDRGFLAVSAENSPNISTTNDSALRGALLPDFWMYSMLKKNIGQPAS